MTGKRKNAANTVINRKYFARFYYQLAYFEELTLPEKLVLSFVVTRIISEDCAETGTFCTSKVEVSSALGITERKASECLRKLVKTDYLKREVVDGETAKAENEYSFGDNVNMDFFKQMLESCVVRLKARKKQRGSLIRSIPAVPLTHEQEQEKREERYQERLQECLNSVNDNELPFDV